jgi:hypothetical protein
VIAHVVLFRPRADSTPEEQQALLAALGRACREIPGVDRAKVGRRLTLGVGYESVVGDLAYSHAAVLEFSQRQALLDYLAHPIHQSLGKLFWQVCDSTQIYDVEMVDASIASISDVMV